MATQTTLLGLTKPDYSDVQDVGVINSNMEIIDKEMGKRSRAYNLLDNSYFLRPINQRGKTSYTGTGYGLDRWRTNFSGDTVEVLAGGVTNTVASTVGGWHLHQIIYNGAELVGKSITAACNAAAITGALYLLISCRDSSDSEIENARKKISAGLNVTSVTVPSGTVYIRVGVYAYASNVSVGDSVTLEWVTLYEGEYTEETLPDYVPKGYAAELLECQTYLAPSNGQGYGYCINASTARLNIPIPVKMKGVPSISDESVTFTCHNNGNNFTATGYSFAEMSDASIRLNLTSDSAFTRYTPLAGYASKNFFFTCEQP